MSNLVIVESPAKAKTIEKYLGADYKVKASMGHLRDLPKKKMGVDLDGDFTPNYIPIEGKDKLISELGAAIKKSDFVYLATDPDREGEAISWHLKELFELDGQHTKRITFNEITKKAVLEAIDSPRDIDMQLVDAQQARRILDRIVGYKLSPFLWKKVKRGLSAGRVQSVVTRIIVEREREIRAFIPDEYWTIELVLSVDGNEFTASFYGDANGKIELKSREDADRVLAAVENGKYTVQAIKRADRKRNPYPPFTTSTLQQDASRKLGMTAKRTMSVAQTLYEGVEISGLGTTGLITYMRTDSLRISEQALVSIREYINEKYGQNYLPSKPRVFKTKKGAQDAHEAIRPTNPALSPEQVRKDLTPDQYKLYKLIWSRFAACQMSEAILDTMSVDIACGGYIFRASGHRVKFPGFTVVYEETRDSDDEDAKSLPEMTEGMSAERRDVKSEQHFTQPPARYTEASLIKEMEDKGIGRPSTYAPTISIIQDREYVVKDGRSLRPTKLGEVITDLMIERFEEIVDVAFTASMENQLDEVEDGKLNYKKLLADFYSRFSQTLEKAERELDSVRIKIPDEETDVVCDLCGRNMVIKSGRFGKFLACPGYPECKNTKPITEQTGGICPVCGGNIVKMKSKKGFAYYGCSNYPKCTFMTWDVPQKRNCPNCDATLFKRYNKEEKKILCLREGCGYSEELKTRAKSTSKAADSAASESKSAGKSTAKKSAAKKKTAAKTAAKTTAKKSAAAKNSSKTAAKRTTAKKTTAKKSEKTDSE